VYGYVVNGDGKVKARYGNVRNKETVKKRTVQFKKEGG